MKGFERPCVSLEALAEHARHVQAFMKEPGDRITGPDMRVYLQAPEERPFSPSSKELRRLYPDAWGLAAMALFSATCGRLSLAFKPANETEWQIDEAFAAYRLSAAKERAAANERQQLGATRDAWDFDAEARKERDRKALEAFAKQDRDELGGDDE